MYRNYLFSDASAALPKLLGDLLTDGDEITSRAGVTKELTHIGITLTHPWRRELLCPGRKPNIAAQIVEAAWVLAGRDDLDLLGKYLPRAYDFSDDGETWRAGYGKRLRAWSGNDRSVDQLAYIVHTLRESHASRQAVMNIWSPTIDTEPGKDIPCNNWLSFSSRYGKLDLMVAIRSNDAMWGWSGINAFEWSVLQEVVAGMLGIGVGGLHFATTSFHLYDRHWAKAREIADAQPIPSVWKDSPRFDASQLPPQVAGTSIMSPLDSVLEAFFSTEKLIRTGSSQAYHFVDQFSEPMLRSWLRVLQWWWSGGDYGYLKELEGTNLYRACELSVQPKPKAIDMGFLSLGSGIQEAAVAQLEPEVADGISPFLNFVFGLHREKHEAYGDSWKRRGEMLGIMANIARKVDRLGGAETSDETAADTAIDLMVYLAKYRAWINDFRMGTHRSDDVHEPNNLMLHAEFEWLHSPASDIPQAKLEDALRSNFDALEKLVVKQEPRRYELVEEMLLDAYILARSLWGAAQ